MSADDDAGLLAERAQALHDETGATTVGLVIDQAALMTPDVDHASITVRGRRHTYRTLESSSQLAETADARQYELREGPCVHATDHGGWSRSGDIAADPRWPRWGPAAAELGMRSLLSIQLLKRGEPYGAINLYCERLGGFADDAVNDHVLLWSTHAASALASAQELTGLETAMASRHVIGLAQGVVMERFDLDEDRAFQLLTRLSSTGNVKLQDLAREIVRTRQVPGVEG